DALGFVNDHYIALDTELWLRLQAAGIRFRRLDAFVAIDRNHAARKVVVLRDQMLRQSKELWPNNSPIKRLAWRTSRLRLRVEGAALVARLYRTPVFDFVRLPNRAELYAYQLCIPRKL